MNEVRSNEAAMPPARFSGLLLKVNVFLLIAAVLVTAFIALVAYKQGRRTRYATSHSVTANALGVDKGKPVRLYAFTVGSVKDMALGQSAVDVELAIVAEHLQR